jgi:hypothetical protein
VRYMTMCLIKNNFVQLLIGYWLLSYWLLVIGYWLLSYWLLSYLRVLIPLSIKALE